VRLSGAEVQHVRCAQIFESPAEAENELHDVTLTLTRGE